MGRHACAVALVAALLAAAAGYGATTVADGDWHSAATWDTGVPGVGATVVVDHSVTIGSSSAALAAVTINGALTFDGWTTVLEAGAVTVNGTVTHAANTDTDGTDGWQPNARVNIECTDLTVGAGGAINANYAGYSGAPGTTGNKIGRGPGGGSPNQAGGSYGGQGGIGGYGGTPAPTYGSATNPVDPGSGASSHSTGALGGAGGGAVRIVASGVLTVRGVISANGRTGIGYQGSGGSGGSVNITCDTFDSTGTISADGATSGNHQYGGGGGGGGRVLVCRNTDVAAGTVTADAGEPYPGHEGQPGTVFWCWANGNPTALCQDATVCALGAVDPARVDAGSYDATGGPVSLALVPAPPYAIGVHTVTLVVTDGGGLTDSCTATVTAVDPASPKVWNGTGDWHADPSNWVPCVPETGDDVIIASGSVALSSSTPALASLTVDAGATLSSDGWSTLVTAVTVTVDGTLTHAANTDTDGTDGWQPNARVNIECTDLTVGAGGAINANYAGYSGAPGTTGNKIGRGPGGGSPNQAGGSYGGQGGIGGYGGTPAPTYGLATDPVDPGSGASSHSTGALGGAGGGAVRLVVSGVLTVRGVISANGSTGIGYQGSGGSGGSVNIACDTLDSTGTISANGASSGNHQYGGGGGGGGRVLVCRNTDVAVGTVTADAGEPYPGHEGQPGTVAWCALIQPPTCDDLEGQFLAAMCGPLAVAGPTSSQAALQIAATVATQLVIDELGAADAACIDQLVQLIRDLQ